MFEKAPRILCPVDFSESSGDALKASVGIMRAYGGDLPVTALFADTFEPPPYFTSGQEKKLAEGIERSIKATAKKVDRFVAGVLGVRSGVGTVVRQGQPVRTILAAAGELDAGLIVMGSHGKSGITRLMLGSVTEKVLAESSIPVLAIRGGEAAAGESFRPTRIVCPVDFSETSKNALKEAVALASRFSARVDAVHIVEEGAESEAREKLCGFVNPGAAASCSLESVVKSGRTAEEVIEIAGSGWGNLIFLGARRKPLGDVTVFGQNVFRITRHARCPVLVLPG